MDSGSKIYVLSLSVETQMAFGLRVFDGFRHAVKSVQFVKINLAKIINHFVTYPATYLFVCLDGEIACLLLKTWPHNLRSQ